jgi:hypothetical protein
MDCSNIAIGINGKWILTEIPRLDDLHKTLGEVIGELRCSGSDKYTGRCGGAYTYDPADGTFDFDLAAFKILGITLTDYRDSKMGHWVSHFLDHVLTHEDHTRGFEHWWEGEGKYTTPDWKRSVNATNSIQTVYADFVRYCRLELPARFLVKLIKNDETGVCGALTMWFPLVAARPALLSSC